MTGNYSVVTNLLGDQDLEIQLRLHHGLQNSNWMYMVYIQMANPELKDVVELPMTYESFSCTIRYNDASLAQVTNSNVWPYGYKGTTLLTYALGTHNSLNVDEKVEDHPYEMEYNPKKTFITSDPGSEEGTEQCTCVRDFETIWSDIPLKAGRSYDFIAGFKVFKSSGFSTPAAKGFSETLQFTILDKANV